MTVAEFIEWLKTQDQGATVECLEGREGRNWQGDSYTETPFDPAKHTDYIDLRGNEFAKGKPYENKRTLLIGRRA